MNNRNPSAALQRDTMISVATGLLVLTLLVVELAMWDPQIATLASIIFPAVGEIGVGITLVAAIVHRKSTFPGIALLAQAPLKHLLLALGAGLLTALVIVGVLHEMVHKGMPFPPAGVTAGLVIVLCTWLTLPQCYALTAHLAPSRDA
jgi:hypothetical protein